MYPQYNTYGSNSQETHSPSQHSMFNGYTEAMEKVQFPLYILSKKNLGENGERKTQRNLTIQSAVKTRGLQAFKSSMYYVFDISQSMEALRIPLLWKELSLILAGGKLSE